MARNIIKHTVASTYVNAIHYMDYEGLEIEERGELNRWLLNEDLSFVTCDNVEELEGVTTCAVTGKLAQCSEVSFLWGRE